jgi:hypothetical protein
MRDLHQFSFSEYDNEQYDVVVIKDDNYPSYKEDGTIYVIVPDNNFYDFVCHNPQEEKIQGFYNEFITNYNKQHNLNLTLTVTPNYYGSIFMTVGFTAKEQQSAMVFIETCLVNDEENICHSEYMPYEYEEFILAHFRMHQQDYTVDEHMSAADVKDCYITDLTVTLGYELSDEDTEFLNSLK